MPKYVAVYGTLRQGFGNHHCMQRAGGTYIGIGKTIEKFQLFAYSIPYVTRKTKDVDKYLPTNIVVEVYEPKDWKPLDSLEGYDPNHPEDENGYYRRPIEVELENGTVVTADLYFYDTTADNYVKYVPSGDYADYRHSHLKNYA